MNCVWNPENKKHKCVKLRWNFDSYKLSQLVLKGGGEKKDNGDSIEPKRSRWKLTCSHGSQAWKSAFVSSSWNICLTSEPEEQKT